MILHMYLHWLPLWWNLLKIRSAATSPKPNLLNKKCELEYRRYLWWHRKCSHQSSVKLWIQKLRVNLFDSVDFSLLSSCSCAILTTLFTSHMYILYMVHTHKCMTYKCSCILLVIILKYISNRKCTASVFCITYQCLHNLFIKIYKVWSEHHIKHMLH
jgi:hypothetical protein